MSSRLFHFFLRGFLIWAAVTAAAGSKAADHLVIGATPVPGGEILEFVKSQLAREGVDLEVKIFTDYIQPNAQLVEKRLDGNLFQHQPFLDEFNRQKNAQLISIARVLIAPMAAYSRRIQDLATLKEGAVVAIPNDPTNGGRALLLLSESGLITLKHPHDILATPKDIVTNPKRLRFRELEAAMLPRVLEQVDLAVINTNYALDAKLNPARDALLKEKKDSPFVNVLVIRPENRESPALKKLAAALNSGETRQFIEQRFGGSVLPAF